jgi:purine-binding chemotaxis protein CheW
MTLLHVVFSVGGAEYVLSAEDVLQMEAYDGATPVPGAVPYVAGVIQVRGRVVPVVDLRARFGLPPADDSADAALQRRVVVGQINDRTVGLLVDGAREVVKLTPEQIQPPPSMLTQGGEDGAGGFVKAVAYLEKRLLMVIDFAKVIGEESVHVG